MESNQKKRRVLLVSNMTIKGGGPVHRLMAILPFLSRQVEVFFAELGPVDIECRGVLTSCCKKCFCLNIESDGWYLKNANEVDAGIEGIIHEVNPDLVVMCWEWWDVLEVVAARCSSVGVAFAAVIFNLPFLDSPPNPSGDYYLDLVERVKDETVPWKAKYILERSHRARSVLDGMNVITTNETTTFYFNTYFTSAHIFEAYPGCAFDPTLIPPVPSGSTRHFDFVFMARLEAGKGVFELIPILEHLRTLMPQVRLLVIGDFLDEKERCRFAAKLRTSGLESHVKLAGFLLGRTRYEALQQAKVLLYPCLFSDTFPICLLETLACGLPAVAYDVPFARLMFGTQAVKRVPYKDTKALAYAAMELLQSKEAAVEGLRFAWRYSSWAAVADAEVRAYHRIIGETKGSLDFPSRE